MAIIRLEDKYKSKYKIQLTPERHYVSSSSGITGSVYVFPNRSETQKDNIDERLNLAPMVEEGTEFSGVPIRAYDSNSLEARREEIFRGELNKFIGGPFADAIQYEYELVESPGGSGYLNQIKTGEDWNDISLAVDDIAERTADKKQFKWTSNDNWTTNRDIYSALPESDRDRSKLRYDVALGLLLDGAHPFCFDSNDHTINHAWRQAAKDPTHHPSGWEHAGNLSFTGESENNRNKYQFSGWKIYTDELGIPYLDAPLTKKSEVNSWPPEALLPEVRNNIISNWVLSGYSDLSMHPRNATKKEVIRKRADYNLFSSGSIFQKAIATRIDELEPFEPGWWTTNYQCLSLSSFNSGANVPALAYANTDDQYKIDWQNDKTTFEFWIKPCKEQLLPGAIVQLDNSYSIALIPDPDTLKNGIYEKFKIGIYAQDRSDLDNWTDPVGPSNSDETIISGDATQTNSNRLGGIYVTTSALNLNQWHHVAIRYGSSFNNGLLNVYVDSVSVTGGNIDGTWDLNKPDPNGRQSGYFYIDSGLNTLYTAAAGDTLFVGGWCPSGGATNLWGKYADKQELSTGTSVEGWDIPSNSGPYGYDVQPGFQLKSELMELRIWSVCRSESELLANKYVGLSATDDLKLYIPFLFDPRSDTPQWNRLGYSPSKDSPDNVDDYYKDCQMLSINSTHLDYNKTQFCTNSAYIVGMPFINVHSHLREYVKGSYPVITQHYDISDSFNDTVYPIIDDQSPDAGVSDPAVYVGLKYFQNHWESFPWLKAINSMLMPCDNSLFAPDYMLLNTDMHYELDASRLKLTGTGIASTSSEYEIARFYDDEVYSVQDTIQALDPEGTRIKAVIEGFRTQALVAENKLEDNDFVSPISTVYAIPQIYYGNRIHPESITLKFKINEEGKEITVKDYDGTLYRVDAVNGGYQAKVGHVDYGNGVLCLFSPLLTNNGSENFDIKLKGEKNLHVMQLDIPCATGVANNSQHPRYKALKASANANESDKNITYISTIYLHDNNLNIIGKVNLAQPVQKREEDSFIFRVKVDF